MAPLQGLTDYVFREAFSKNFAGINAYFVPYISLKNGAVPNKQLKEILPENNCQQRVIPQVLFKDSNELKELIKIIKDNGYQEINLNLGCPYPMITNRGKGAGLLPSPEKLYEILNDCLHETGITYSAKLRTGLIEIDEIYPVIKVLNQFPFSEIIYHPRLASQLFKGQTDDKTVTEVLEISEHPVVLNGDINSLEIYTSKKILFPSVETWMLGRRILINPFLAEELNGINTKKEKRLTRLEQFHLALFNSYSEKLSGSGHLLAKMTQFWEYFSFAFENRQKVFKQIKKANRIDKYNFAIKSIFSDIY
jgi:tRNA-dihydrouridine synthase B